jgi:hypothetical protein
MAAQPASVTVDVPERVGVGLAAAEVLGSGVMEAGDEKSRFEHRRLRRRDLRARALPAQ